MTDLLAGQEQAPSLAQQVECIERELKMRAHVFPRRVADKKMTQAKADHELTVMRAVLAALKAVAPVGIVTGAVLKAFAEQRDPIPDSDLDDEQPIALTVRLTLGDIRRLRRSAR